MSVCPREPHGVKIASVYGTWVNVSEIKICNQTYIILWIFS